MLYIPTYQTSAVNISNIFNFIFEFNNELLGFTTVGCSKSFNAAKALLLSVDPFKIPNVNVDSETFAQIR